MEKFEKFVLGVIVGMAFVMITFMMTSCSASKGTGCRMTNNLIGYR